MVEFGAIFAKNKYVFVNSSGTMITFSFLSRFRLTILYINREVITELLIINDRKRENFMNTGAAKPFKDSINDIIYRFWVHRTTSSHFMEMFFTVGTY